MPVATTNLLYHCSIGKGCGMTKIECGNCRSLLKEVRRLKRAIKATILQNGHLADGDNCTLKLLKDALTPTK